MFRKAIWFIVLLSFICFSCDTEGTIDPAYKNYFIKYYGGDGNQTASDFVVNSDGSIVMVGTWYENNGDRRIYIVKVNEEGNIIWSRKVGETRESVRNIDVFQGGSFAGNYMILSNLKHTDTDSTDVKVVVIDNENGNPVDSILFNQYFTQFGYSITALSDGGFTVAGSADTLAQSDQNIISGIYVQDEKDNLSLRFDQNLVIYGTQWRKSWGKETRPMAVKVLERVPDQFAYAGNTDALQPTYEDPDTGEDREDVLRDQNFYFSKLDPVSGLIDGNDFYAGNPSPRFNEFLAGIAKSPSGPYLAIGTQIDQSQHRIYTATINSGYSVVTSEGAIISNVNMDGVAVTASGMSNVFWILGNESRVGGRDIWIGRVNSGTPEVTEFTMTFGAATNDDTGSAIAELPNGDLLILGTMELVNQKKMALIKVRPNGKF